MEPYVFDIRPFDGVGPINLGMTRQDLRRLLGGKVKAFRKSNNSPALSDLFHDYEAIAYYSADDRLDAFEFGQGTIEWNGIQLMGRIAGDVYDEIAPHSTDVELKAGATFHDLGFGLYVPAWRGVVDRDDEHIVEAVIVFSRTHYQR